MPRERQQQELPLFAAAKVGDTERISELLNAGANVNQLDDKGNTPLMLAALEGKKEAIILLLNNGADASILRTSDRSTAVTISQQQAQKYHSDKFVRNGASDTFAQMARDQDAMTRLLAMTPQEYAIERRRHGAMQEQDAARLEQKTRDRSIRETHQSFVTSCADVVDMPEQIPDGIDLNYSDTGKAALSAATSAGNTVMVDQLIERGVRYDDMTHNLSEDFAKHPDTLKKMIKFGLQWNGSFYFTDCVNLTEQEKQGTVKAYIACYLDVNCPDGTEKEQELEKHISSVLQTGFSGNTFVQEHSDIVAKTMLREYKGVKESTTDKILDAIDRIISTVSSKAAMQRELKEKAQHMVYSMKDKQPQVERGANLNTPNSPRATAINDDRGR